MGLVIMPGTAVLFPTGSTCATSSCEPLRMWIVFCAVPTGRPAGAGAHQVRAGNQPQDREGARHRNSADAARARRRGDRMKRRGFIALIGGAAATRPFAARAQQPAKQPLIDMLRPGTRATHRQWFAAPVDRVRDLDWIDGRTVAFEYRFAEGRTDRAAEIVAEFVRMKVDLIATSAADVTLAAKQVTSAIPIVTLMSDPIGTGLIASFNRPGGNVTGISVQQ